MDSAEDAECFCWVLQGRLPYGERKICALAFYKQSTSYLKDSHFTHPICTRLSILRGAIAGHKIQQFKNAQSQFIFLKEFQKEQADSETIVMELDSGKSVKSAPKKKCIAFRDRLTWITQECKTYKDENKVLEFLKAVANTIKIQFWRNKFTYSFKYINDNYGF